MLSLILRCCCSKCFFELLKQINLKGASKSINQFINIKDKNYQKKEKVFVRQTSLFIIGEDSVFHNDTKISVACNENTFDLYDPNLIFSLNNQTKSPLRLLNIKGLNDSNEKITVPESLRKSSYELDQSIQIEQNSTISAGILKYITNNNNELLCIGRGRPRNYLQRVFSNNPKTVSGVINQIQTPILVMGTSSN